MENHGTRPSIKPLAKVPSVGLLVNLLKKGKVLPVSFYYGGRMKPKKETAI